jgi:hypothetical protein
MNHTPGPWETHQDIDGRNSVRVCKPDGEPEDEAVAWIYENVGRGCRPIAEAEIIGMSRLEAEANARLIAAAPELLEACKESLPYIEGPGDSYVYGLIKAAIEKAEGK